LRDILWKCRVKLTSSTRFVIIARALSNRQAFNEELDGMFNDANLPETEAFTAMRRDLQLTKASRNELALENMYVLLYSPVKPRLTMKGSSSETWRKRIWREKSKFAPAQFGAATTDEAGGPIFFGPAACSHDLIMPYPVLYHTHRELFIRRRPAW
jgi:hypothetical protein